MRVAGRFHPTARDKAAEEMESVPWAVEEDLNPQQDVFEKFVRGIQTQPVIKDRESAPELSVLTS